MEKNPELDWSKLVGALVVGGYFAYCGMHASSWHLIDNVDLIFHEAGHTITYFFGQFIMILGGSFIQAFIPFGLAYYFFFKRDFYAASLLFSWFGYNLVNIAVYINDSLLMQLPLLGGDNVIHDWNYLLSMTGLLKHTYQIASLVNGIGLLAILASIILSLYFSKKRYDFN